MKKICLFFVIFSMASLGRGQNSDTSLISIANFQLHSGTYSWRDGNTFHNMTGWNTAPYTEGHLKQQNGSNSLFRLNYRLLFPNNYDASYKDGYPILIMFHGAGERGNCWDTNCYCTDCDPNSPEANKADAAYLNNDHMLAHGGQPFLNAVNLAGSKKAEDPSLNAKAFPGFVLFPQMENNWGSESASSSVAHSLRVLRLLLKKHNINEDRVYIAGLSMGGQAVLKALSMADWLFAAAICMSPVPYTKNFDFEGAVSIPIWIFQGGKDQYPKPSHSEEFIRLFRQAGGSVKYTFYEDAGHNTWSRAFKDPDFFSWLLQYRKNNIFRYFEDNYICTSSDEGLKMTLPKGFPAYQWQLEKQTITGADDYLFVAKKAGTYRGRFSRIANPKDKDWNEWSESITINEYAPPAPLLRQEGTTFLPDLNGNNEAVLYTDNNYQHYYWEKGGAATSLPDTNRVVLERGSCNSKCANNGTYTLKVADFNQCKGAASEGLNVFFNNQAPVVNAMLPTTLTAEAMSSSSVFLSWDDASGLETGYEIWRKNKSRNGSKWELATITTRSITFYYDTMLIPGSVYGYKIRAINHTSRSDYFPSNNENTNIEIQLSTDNDKPFPPQNLKATLIDVNKVKLVWDAGKDESGIAGYLVTYGDKTIQTDSPIIEFILEDLDPRTNYPVTVQTVDISGNISSPSNQVIISTSFQGLFYKHSTGAWNSLKDPSIEDTWDDPEHTGLVENVTLKPRVQEEYFNFEFNGYLDINTSGDYTFYLNSDDGSRMFLNGEMIIDYDGFHTMCKGGPESTTCPNGWGKPSNTIKLGRGKHLVKIQFFQYTGGKNIQLRYRGPDSNFSAVIIPNEAFTSGSSPSQKKPEPPTGLSGKHAGMTAINLSWKASPSADVAYEIYRSLNSSGPYQILDKTTTLSYSDNGLIPGKTYYYRLRAVSPHGVSSLTSSINVRTEKDNEPPTIPTSLVIQSGSLSKAILRWEPSTDNIGVAGYEIWANDKLIGKSKIAGFEAINKPDGNIVEYYVIAYDLSGNRSGKSDRVANEAFITDTEGQAGESHFEVYPNPGALRDLRLVLPGNLRGSVTIVVTDLLEKELITKQVEAYGEAFEIQLNTENHLPNGLYIFLIEQGSKKYKKKVMIRN